MTQFAWVPCENGAIPHQAVQGGMESDGSPLYVGRGEYKGSTQVGKVSPNFGGLLIGYGSKEIKIKQYEQVPLGGCRGAALPEDWIPVEAGWEADGQKLFIAKAEHVGGLQVGKAGPHLSNGMTFCYGSKELTAEAYWVLVHFGNGP
ncbi:hypothetical protein BDF19DRAFT_428369 [Syncephalis fuscata]|nr:hypothetical protein BDF19DRAFT_428369 [Syncephalis fuscata]